MIDTRGASGKGIVDRASGGVSLMRDKKVVVIRATPVINDVDFEGLSVAFPNVRAAQRWGFSRMAIPASSIENV